MGGDGPAPRDQSHERIRRAISLSPAVGRRAWLCVGSDDPF